MTHPTTPFILTPPPILLDRYPHSTWEANTLGRSGMTIWRIITPDQPTCYIKAAPAGPLMDELRHERDVLHWLHGRIPAPTVLASDHALAPTSDATSEPQNTLFLTISEVPGVPTSDPTDDIPALVRLLATGLRLLHSFDYSYCPFDRRLDHTLTLAHHRAHTGLVDESDFDAERQGMSALALYQQLQRDRPPTEDLVFTHGDYCLPNVLFDPTTWRLTGFIDLGRAGVADRYQDLALAARSLAYNVGSQWEPLLWQAYGLTHPDQRKLDYYRLLDEFF